LKNLPLFKKIIKAGLLTAFSYYAAWFLDGFIFGEYYKARPFRLFFPWTKHVYLSYYSDIQQIISYPPRDISKECICLYSGPLIQGKGFDKVLNVVSNCAKRFPETQFILHIISKDDLDNSFSHIQNLKVEKQSFLPFPDFCETIGKADLFFDLRDIDFETTHCLPIKLFYYLATGRPVVYSNLKAIRKEVSEMSEIGVFIDPENTDAIVSQMAQYLQNNDFYKKQCYFARQLAEEKYNWEKIEQPFIQFIQSFF
jgi:glycosyltransferase involved in cell wall biosynthesis